MKALFVCFVLFIKITCMPIPSGNTATCIQDLITHVESQTFMFSDLKQTYGFGKDSAEIFQFRVKDAAPCFKEATFVKGYAKDRLENLVLTLAAGYETTLAELGTTFGEFRMAPPEPGATWTASARYKTANEKVHYAIIAEAREKLTQETQIRNISIRLDYQD